MKADSYYTSNDSLLFLEVTLSLFLVGFVVVGKMTIVGLQFDEFELH